RFRRDQRHARARRGEQLERARLDREREVAGAGFGRVRRALDRGVAVADQRTIERGGYFLQLHRDVDCCDSLAPLTADHAPVRARPGLIAWTGMQATAE